MLTLRRAKPACKHFSRRAAILPILFYKLCISPFLPKSCRYWPSCSSYAIEAITRHGIIRGGYYAVHRLLRCHPWGVGGYDPVPPLPSPLHRSH